MKHKTSMRSILLIGILATSCVKLNKKTEDSASPPPTATEPVVQSELNHSEEVAAVQAREVKAKPTAFRYFYKTEEASANVETQDSLVFEFPEKTSTDLILEKVILAPTPQKTQLKVKLNEEMSWTDTQTSQQFKILYRFTKAETNEVVNEVEVLPNLNLTLNSDINLLQVFNINRKTPVIYIKNLFLNNRARIFLNDYIGDVYIENLVSADGAIQTFENSQRAPTGKNGRSVGPFKVHIQNGSGQLRVLAYAESGGDGLAGVEPNASMQGAQGKAGALPRFTDIGREPCSLATGTICMGGTNYGCAAKGGPGGMGGRGQRGHSGTDGGHGGNVSLVKVFSSSADLQIQLETRSGQKGLGGPGGAGGLGGEGGLGSDGGEKDFIRFFGGTPGDQISTMRAIFGKALTKPCDPMPNGERGPNGEVGARGHDGLDGVATVGEVIYNNNKNK